MKKYCTKCGVELYEGATFCAKCGTPQDVATSNNDVKKYTNPQPVYPNNGTVNANNNSGGNASNNNRLVVLLGGVIVVMVAFGAFYFMSGGSDNKKSEPVAATNTQQAVTSPATVNNEEKGKQVVADTALDYHWCRDTRNGVLIWNPNPTQGETVTWQGGYKSDGNNRYADGNGTATWYLNGEYEQRDEGTYHNGVRDGVFVQYFPDGRVKHSRWVNGNQVE
ncbi:MAG: zinc ribbon domain-containing protein [Anaerovibrio sp.]|nr:zinc ribbon domain-containing protein [Anaerovibrio sp.]